MISTSNWRNKSMRSSRSSSMDAASNEKMTATWWATRARCRSAWRVTLRNKSGCCSINLCAAAMSATDASNVPLASPSVVFSAVMPESRTAWSFPLRLRIAGEQAHGSERVGIQYQRIAVQHGGWCVGGKHCGYVRSAGHQRQLGPGGGATLAGAG